MCVYCVPSKPIDVDREVSYHEDVLGTIIEGAGYKAKKIEEAVAIGYEGLVDNNLTGIAMAVIIDDMFKKEKVRPLASFIGNKEI